MFHQTLGASVFALPLKKGLQQENCSQTHYQLLETQPSKTSKTNTPQKINAVFADW